MDDKKLTIGILAHVDAGKTTLSESMLYICGSITKLGRVDHKNAFLDIHELERARGITIFSKQAEFNLGEKEVTLLDTPGHVDFAAEMERTLQVLDYAILLISGADGIQGHTTTLWNLLDKYKIPVFIFVNKMDQMGTDKELLMKELTAELSEQCVYFNEDREQEEFMENIALCDEIIMNQYLSTGDITEEEIIGLISKRKLFPCYFGSALKLTGIDDFIEGLTNYTKVPVYSNSFGAKVYKISRDKQGARLTHMKITGGVLGVKDVVTKMDAENEIKLWEEKIEQIRVYSGEKYTACNSVKAGTICSVVGLTKTYTGEGLGFESDITSPIIEPVLNYQIMLPDGCNINEFLSKLRILEEEEPLLKLVYHEQLEEIHVQVMGEVEIEILKSLLKERFNLITEFRPGGFIYKETISEPVIGRGHFEPLRHYAEVHLLLEPSETGSGLVFESDCSEDILGRNWQRLVLSQLQDKPLIGVLTGSEITDIKITLIAGKAHLKHTEGGDFRQAAHRALRQGLRKAKSVLLEPVYEFHIEVPSEYVGRVLSDVQKMHGSAEAPDLKENTAVITGWAPASEIQNYQMELIAYSKGYGKMFYSLKGYEPCHNAEEIIAQKGYNADSDLNNPADSVFCSHGSGYIVEWDQSDSHMHVESSLKSEYENKLNRSAEPIQRGNYSGVTLEDEKELEEIFRRTYGTSKREESPFKKKRILFKEPESTVPYKKNKQQDLREKYLLIDGYNIIFAWDELKELAKVNIDAARDQLMDLLCSYQGYKNINIILVFDAYKVSGNTGSVQKYNNINVVYTKEAETADQYIEKVVHKIGYKYDVSVATSDALEQIIIWGDGARKISALGLKKEIDEVNDEIRSAHLNQLPKGSNYPFQTLLDDIKTD